MLIGEYTHTIDAKNRISLPAKFRKELGKTIIVTPGLDQCLFVFSKKEWEKVAKKLSSSEGDLSFLQADQRTFNRNMFGGASEIELDSIGRVLLPDFLMNKGKLKDTGVFIGVGDRLEIWNDKIWAEFKQKAEREAEVLAEKLAKNGHE